MSDKKVNTTYLIKVNGEIVNILNSLPKAKQAIATLSFSAASDTNMEVQIVRRTEKVVRSYKPKKIVILEPGNIDLDTTF